MDRLESMAILVNVAEAGSLSAASRHLKMPLPTLSRKISELEAHLKTRLLNRSTRLLTLTDAGERYLAATRRILEDVEQAERAATGEYNAPKGELVLTAPVVFGRTHLMPVIVDFLKAYPDIDVRLALHERVVNLQEEHVDLAARLGSLPDSSLMAVRIGEVRRILVASPTYLAARGTPLHPADLAVHDCISFNPTAQTEAWAFPVGKTSESFPVHFRLVVTTAQAAIDAAIAGIGISRVFCYHVAEARAAGLLVPVLQDYVAPPIPLHLVYPAGRMLPLKLRAFLDFATPRLIAALSKYKGAI
jgi:DNA-binding transcriptional LysR family regulator